MNSDSKGAPLLHARTLPPPQPQQPPARKAGEARLVEVNGRLVKLVTIARPAAVPRPVDPKPLQPAAVHPQPHTQPQLQALPHPQPQPSTNDKGQASAAAGLAGRLVHELLQSLLMPAQLLRLFEQLRAVEPHDPKYAQAQAAQRKVLADHGRFELPQAVDRIVHALMLQTRGTPHKDAVDRALVDMLAIAGK